MSLRIASLFLLQFAQVLLDGVQFALNALFVKQASFFLRLFLVQGFLKLFKVTVLGFYFFIVLID